MSLQSRAMDLVVSQAKNDRLGLMNYFQSASQMWIEILVLQVQRAPPAKEPVKEWRLPRKGSWDSPTTEPSVHPTSSGMVVAP